MASKTSSAKPNQAFSGKVSLKFMYKKNESSNVKTMEIGREKIQYVMIKYQYENVNVLPVIYISLKVPLELNDKILGTYQTSTFHLKITRRNGLSNTSATVNVVDDTFNYVCSDTNVNQSPVLSNNGNDDTRMVATTVGLVSKTQTEKLREPFNGNYMETDTQGLINDVALKGLGKVVASPIAYNKTYDEFQVSSLNTRYKMLKYAFDDNPYYDTNFTFFMDFNKTYLVAKDGKAVEDGGKASKCVINITDAVDRKSFSTGNSIDGGAYNIYINAANTDIHVDEGTDQNVNKLVAFGYDTGDQQLYVGGSGSGGKDKSTFLRTNNVALQQNEITNSRVMVEVFKSAIDSTMLTPNKAYVINHLNNYKKYNGNYILSYKTESYTPMSNDNFTITTSAGFKLIEQITKANAIANDKVNHRYDSGSTESTAANNPANTNAKNDGIKIANRSAT